MSSTEDLADRPTRLPVQVRLRRGESVDSFIRRLAIANHLRPSYLRTFLNYPPGAIGSLQITRLAQVTGRTVVALTHVFPGLDPDRRAAKPVIRAKPRNGGPAPVDVATTIRVQAGRDEMVNRLSRQFGVHRRTVIQALTGQPPRRRTQASTYPILAPHLDQIGGLLAENPDVTCMSVWKTLTEEHHAEVSYGTVRAYLFDTRAHPSDTRPVQLRTSRVRLFEQIRAAAGEDFTARLAARLALPPAVVLQALHDDAALPVRPTRPPAPALTGPQRHRRFTPNQRAAVDAMISADPQTLLHDIWVRLVDDHHADVSYATVRSYVARAHPSQTRKTRGRPRILTTQTRAAIDQIVQADPTASVRQIWERLTDDHAVDASYATVREYVAREHRPARKRSKTPDAATTAHLPAAKSRSGADSMRRPTPGAAAGHLG